MSDDNNPSEEWVAKMQNQIVSTFGTSLPTDAVLAIVYQYEKECRSLALDELTRLGQEMGGYDDDEVITPKRIQFALDSDSTAIILLEYDGLDVLTAAPGGGIECYGEPVTEREIAMVLKDYMEEKRH